MTVQLQVYFLVLQVGLDPKPSKAVIIVTLPLANTSKCFQIYLDNKNIYIYFLIRFKSHSQALDLIKFDSSSFGYISIIQDV